MDGQEEGGGHSFRGGRRRAVRVSAQALVKTGHIQPGQTLPLVVEPAVRDIDPALWAADHREWVEAQLRRHGALLFRGFELGSLPTFEQFMRAITPDLLDYDEPTTPRTKVGGKVFTSTDYPADQPIELHNELSYSHRWPEKLFFYCVNPADRGGATPIADSREVYALLDPEVREAFTRRGVLYVRNFAAGLGLTWQEVFKTDEKAAVEEYCRGAGIHFEWRDGHRLRTRQVRPAVLSHPRTGEPVWFNQAHIFHVAGLPAAVREAMLSIMPLGDVPQHALFGDGAPIGEDVVGQLRAAYRRAAVSFEWQRHDLLLVDNVLVAHGRAPFEGDRKILVGMGNSAAGQL